MAQITLVEAINQAIASEMARDPDVVMMGQDSPRRRGVSRDRRIARTASVPSA